jgi:hypothetical protein
MQTMQHPLAGFAVVVLNEVKVLACDLLEITTVEALKEETTVITEDLGLQNKTSGRANGVTV